MFGAGYFGREMGRMFDATEKPSSRLLKPPGSKAAASQSRSGPASYNAGKDAAPRPEAGEWRRYFTHSQGFEQPKVAKNNAKNSKKKDHPIRQQEQQQQQQRFWGWRFFHYRAFDCVFSIHIHAIRDLPVYLTHGILLEVHCLRKARSSKTLASRALNGSVEFEETLHLHSKVRASRASPHAIKHPVSKSFQLLIVSSFDQAVLGELTLDLGSILPAAIGDTADFAASSAWTAAFMISASENLKGASVVASIGYEFVNFSKSSGGGGGAATTAVPAPSNPSIRTESCRFANEQQHNRPALWRRLRPLSGLVNVSSTLFARSESLKSMPDLAGLAQEACSSSCSDNDQGGEDHNQDEEDLRTAPDSRLDSMLCSLVQAQIQSTSDASSKRREKKPTIEEPVEISKEDYSLDDSTGSEEEVDSIAETGKELAIAKVTPKIHEDHAADSTDRSATNIYDEANSVARQFLKMLEEGDESAQSPEPLGSPVYEGNWILAPIPEEEDEGDAASTRYIPIAAPVPKLQLPSSSPEPAMDSVDFQAFVPTWKKEDDLDLACIMKAAEVELHRATTHVMKTRAGLVEDVETEAFMRRWGLGETATLHDRRSEDRSSGSLGARRTVKLPI